MLFHINLAETFENKLQSFLTLSNSILICFVDAGEDMNVPDMDELEREAWVPEELRMVNLKLQSKQNMQHQISE